MQLTMRNNVKDDRISEYIDWVKANEAAMHEHAPDGWSYLGTWVTVYGMGTHEIETRFELDDYGAMSPENTNEEWNRLVKESSDFFSTATMQNSLMKSVGDVSVIA